MTTPSAILTKARATLAAMATSRDASEFFLEHKTNVAFEESPVSKRDGFEIVQKDYDQTSGFGVLGQKESQFTMVVRLGHAPFGKEENRENARVDDIERIVDVFEAHTWPSGTFLVVQDKPPEVEKKRANWWVTEIYFKVVLTGAIRT